MKKTGRRIVGILLSICMVLTMTPMAFAAGDDETGDSGVAASGNITTEDALTEAIESTPGGGTVTLEGDITVTKPIVINKEITLNLNGKKISNEAAIWSESDGKWSLLEVAGGNLTITGGGIFQALEDDCYAIDIVNGGS